jgi:glycosyltransferase involved in cell wall biosynthesis
MQKRGYEYIVVSSRGDLSLPSNTTFNGIPVQRFTFWQSIFEIDSLAQVKQQVANLKRLFAPDLIHINGVGRDDFFHLVTVNAHRSPLLVTLHGEWASQADAIVRLTLTGADWVVGCSNAILDKARKLAPEIIPRSCVIFNAVPEGHIPPEPLSMHGLRVLCLGRLSEEKGFDLGLAAFASIVEHFPHARLIIAGDGPERAKLARQASQLRLSDAVEFIGWVAPKDVPALINTATIVMIPSRLESLPIAALQAAQMARPVVGTRVGGIPELVIHQQTGLLVDKENPEALAKAMAFLFDNPQEATRMGQAARDRVKTKFDWERHVNAYERLYQELTNAGATRPFLSREN